MWWAVKQLSIPINYLRIRNGDGWFHSKRTYDFVLPCLLALAACAYFWWLSISFAVFDHPVLIKRISDLLALMIVFYMAALAAVATFDRDGIDNELEGEPAILSVRDPNNADRLIDKTLSYRQFISYLFGYLSFLSLMLYVFVIACEDGWKKLEIHFQPDATIYHVLTTYIDPLLSFLLFAAMSQLVITSLLGIYFLTERIQTLTEKPPDDGSEA
jgi:hypothetical protein